MSARESPIRSLLASSGVMTLLYAGSTGLTFFVGVLLARLLGASGYGVYALAMTSATLAGMVTEFGLPVLAMREVGAARARGDWSQAAGLIRWADRTILTLSLLLAVAVWGGTALFAQERSSAYLATLLWAVALVPFVAIGKLRSFVLLALDRVMASQFPVMILRPALFIAGCLVLWLAAGQLTPQAAMAVQAGGAAFAMLVVLLLFRRHRPPALATAQPALAVRGWLGACVPMGMTEGLRLLQGQLGLILTGVFATAAQAGLYRVADAVTMVTVTVTSVIGTAVSPTFARLWSEGDVAGTQRIATVGALAMAAGSLAIGLPLAFVGSWLFPMAFGAEFAGSVQVFWLLWAGSLAAATLGPAFALANMIGQHVLVTRAFVLVALVNLAAGSVLSHLWGAQGAAGASAAATLAGTAYCALGLRRATTINATVFTADARLAASEALALARRALSSAAARVRGRGDD